MKLADGREDYFVSIRCENREISIHKFDKKWMADYEVAELNHVLQAAPKPMLCDFDPETTKFRKLHS